MSKILTIYVDMDGVLCDFNKRFLELYKDVPEVDYRVKVKKRKHTKVDLMILLLVGILLL